MQIPFEFSIQISRNSTSFCGIASHSSCVLTVYVFIVFVVLSYFSSKSRINCSAICFSTRFLAAGNSKFFLIFSASSFQSIKSQRPTRSPYAKQFFSSFVASGCWVAKCSIMSKKSFWVTFYLWLILFGQTGRPFPV